MRQGVGGAIETRPNGVHHAISLGGKDAIRSIAKSCLVLLSTVVGNEAVKSEAFAAVREFVVSGGTDFNKARVRIDFRDIPSADALTKDYGSFFNLIYVRSGSSGRVIGHFTLYNIIGWQIVLADAGAPRDRKMGLISNPLDPFAWSDAIGDALDIPSMAGCTGARV